MNGNINIFNPASIFWAADGLETQLPANANLNSNDYTVPGKYKSGPNSEVGNYTNCPTISAFVMYVINMSGPGTIPSSANIWSERVRIVLSYLGHIYTQNVENNNGTVVYGPWNHVKFE